MKTVTYYRLSKPGHGRGRFSRTVALLGSLALLAILPGICLQAQTPGISSSVFLFWPEPSDTNIVVAADSLSGPVWIPCLEPIIKRFGQMGMTVPTIANQQFFKLVPGNQFADDFSELTQPYTNRNPWVPYIWNTSDTTRFSFTVTNGALRLRALTGPVDGRVALAPPGPLITYRDLIASVDILGFTGTVNELRPCIAICARAWIDSPWPGYSNTYLGGIRSNPPRLQIFDGRIGHPGPSFTYDPAATYRLQFSVVGTNLTLRLMNLATGQTLEQPLNDTYFTQGYVMLWVEATPGGSYDVTVDNFLVSGTKP